MEITLAEGRVFGARYYTAAPDFWDVRGVMWDSIMAWSTATFGPTPSDGIWTPGARWYANDRKLWFRKESDRALFLLKWQ